MKETKYVSIENSKEEINNKNIDFGIILESENIDIMEICGEKEEINKYLEDNKDLVKLLTKKEANELGRKLVIGTPIIYDNEYGKEFETVIKNFNVDDGVIFDEISDTDDIEEEFDVDEIWHTLRDDGNKKIEISNLQRFKINGELKWTNDLDLLEGVAKFLIQNIKIKFNKNNKEFGYEFRNLGKFKFR